MTVNQKTKEGKGQKDKNKCKICMSKWQNDDKMQKEHLKYV